MEQDKDIVATSTNPLDAAFGGFDTLATQVAESQAAVSSELDQEGAGGVEFINFMKWGDQGDISPWEFGFQEKTQIPPDSVWVVDTTTFQHGWMGFEPDKENKPQKGQQPDTFFVPWTQAFPAQPRDMPWARNRAFKFRCVCVHSPGNPEVEGVYAEVSDWRKMKKGYAELERALRDRVQQAAQAKARGDTELFETLRGAFFPKIKFSFKLGIPTKNYGKHNQGIIEHVGWSGQIIREEDRAEPEEAPALEDEVEEAQAETPEQALPARRRRK